ncbi:P-loop containing nucleoside triphosphate hydrolase protein, partial [Ochromonadaceae sp. CCMP2298]
MNHCFEKTSVLNLPGGYKGGREKQEKVFGYEHVFPPTCEQEDIYDAVAENVLFTVQGYNTTIFTYGATGSGKSYTMTGIKGNVGITPRVVEDIFKIIGRIKTESVEVAFHVEMSYVELYNNGLRNLLKPALDKINIHESISTGVFLSGPHLRIPVRSGGEALKLVWIGNKFRTFAAMKANDASSRSHSVLTVYVESKVAIAGKPRSELRLGKIHLVDLAGSERVAESKAVGSAMVETQNINKSLLALGEVLHALGHMMSLNTRTMTSPTPALGEMHVPYLNSKLTHLLKDSLGGNSKTIMLATVGSEVDEYHYTLHSLQYALRATKVRN